MKYQCLDLSFQYPHQKMLFEHLNLSLEEGQILSVLGPNGAGKSTLLKCLLGFVQPIHGTCMLNQQDIHTMSRKQFFQLVSYVPQARANQFPFSVIDTVLLGRSAYLGMFHQPKEKDYQIAEEAMKKTGILHLKDMITSHLSGGELQLVLIARALCSKPQLLILDEPETGLDFYNQMKIMALLEQFRKEGMSIIFNTHDPSHALQISDQSLLLLPDGSHCIGDTKDIVNSRNLEKAYGLPVHIDAYQQNEKTYYSVIPIGGDNNGTD